MTGSADRHWPAHTPPDPAETIHADCDACGLRWAVHSSMAGFRLRCECGAWVNVPAPDTAPAALPGPEALEVAAADADSGAGLPVARPFGARPDDGGAPAMWPAPRPEREVPLVTDTKQQKRRLNIAFTELLLLFFAFVGPASLIQIFAGPELMLVAMPLTGMMSGVLVLSIGACFNPLALTSSLGLGRIEHWFEALVAAAAFLALAFGWMELLTPMLEDAPSLIGELRDAVGVEWALFTVAFCPAVFEELAFRGQVRSRMNDMFGPEQGFLLTAVAFALAHGVTLALPLHFGIGLYLGWLRNRSGTLLPGMLIHLLYNGTLVLAEP